MRSLVDISDKILAKIPNNKDAYVSLMKDKVEKVRNKCLYKAPELVIEEHYWEELSSAVLEHKDSFYNKMWYCEIVAILSDRSYDEIVKALAADHKS